MNGAVPVLHLYAVMVWMDKYILFYFIGLNSDFIPSCMVLDLSVLSVPLQFVLHEFLRCLNCLFVNHVVNNFIQFYVSQSVLFL
jgi:hypothetical protein